MRIAICDDDGALRSDLRSALDRSLAGRNVRARYQEYTAGERLVADAANGDPFDLVFLDVYLEGVDGVSAARALRAVDAAVPIVFLTVSREHAVESYEVRATDYLMKPLDPAAIERVLDRVLPASEPRLAFRVGASRRYFAFGDIVYLESRDHSVLLHGRSLPSRLGQARRRAAGSERSPLPALPSQLFGEHGLHSRRLRRFHSTRRNMRAGTRERASQDARGLSPLLRRCPMRGPRRSLGAALA